MGKKTRVKAKRAKRAEKLPPLQTTDLDHARRFDQLLDDAIFGVKKKPIRRG